MPYDRVGFSPTTHCLRLNLLAITALLLAACSDNGPASVTGPDAAPGVTPDPVKVAAARLIDEGRQTFRYDTFGDEAFWGRHSPP
jgi:hypothetical protein